jgi:hypothetical protein
MIASPPSNGARLLSMRYVFRDLLECHFASCMLDSVMVHPPPLMQRGAQVDVPVARRRAKRPIPQHRTCWMVRARADLNYFIFI